MIASLARKILNALHSLGAVLGGLNNNVQSFFDLSGVARFQQELCTTQNAGERVIEIVRYPGR